MRKVGSVIFALLILFNTIGYYGVIIGWKFKAADELTSMLDADQIDEKDLILIKTPLALPYHSDDVEYERVDGEVEHEGQFYRLVKQKLAQDTLYILCVKDHQSSRIKSALADYVKTFTDKPAHAKQNSKLAINFIKDYIGNDFALESTNAGWNAHVEYASIDSNVLAFSLCKSSPPPRA